MVIKIVNLFTPKNPTGLLTLFQFSFKCDNADSLEYSAIIQL
jgi:hypothetical protein